MIYDTGGEPLNARLTRLTYAAGGHEVASRACDIEVDGQPVHIEAGQALTLAQAVAYPHPVETVTA